MKVKSISKLIDYFENGVTGLALVGIVGAVMWGVLTRYITDQPAGWTSEISGILFTWVVFIGAMSVYRRGGHVNVPIMVNALPPRVKRVLQTLSELITFLFVLYAAYLSFGMMLKGATRPSPVLGVPFSYVYLAALIGFTVMSFSSAHHMYRLLLPSEESSTTSLSTDQNAGGQ